MSNLKKIYSCSKCGAQSPKWSGRCLECGAWGTVEEETLDAKQAAKEQGKEAAPAQVINLEKTQDFGVQRKKTGFPEVDRVFGGGVVPGSLTLIGGEPGIGKSTMVAQIADKIARSNGKVIYVSGEESAGQIKARLTRLGCDLANISFISETNVEKIVSAVKKEGAELVVVDSIQTVYSSLTESEPGSVSQIRAATVSFLEAAKENNIPFFLIGHITKDGAIAGPKSLEHIVDTVVYLEVESSNNFRILRTTKNRFGSVNELGVFEMTGSGFVEVKNPSAIFIETGSEALTGSVLSSVMEGTRPFMIDVQALVTKTAFGYPQRKASGFDLNRLQVLVAVLSKKANVNLMNQDVVLNVVGGLKVNDPGVDLAVCLSICSSLLDQIIDRQTIVLGEVGLGGEVRPVSKLDIRLAEAEKLGFKKAIIPAVKAKSKGLELRKIKNIGELLKF